MPRQPEAERTRSPTYDDDYVNALMVNDEDSDGSTLTVRLTNRRLIYKRGIIWRVSREVNLAQIESVDVGQSILGRLLGYGEIAVRGTGGSWDPIPIISRPLMFRSHITAADLHRVRSA